MQDADPRQQGPRGDRGRSGPVGGVISGLDACTHCGLCNAVCPTYLETGDERESPRGRIALMQLLSEPGIRDPDVFETAMAHLESCVMCGACEPACPEAVPFAREMRRTRAEIVESGAVPRARAKVYQFFASRIATPEKLGRLFRMLRAMPKVSRRLLGDGLELLAEGVAAAGARDGSGSEFGVAGTALTSGVPRGRVLLVGGCLERIQRPAIVDAAIRLLARRGYDVEVPSDAGCCGAIADELGTRSVDRSFAIANRTGWGKVLQRQPRSAETPRPPVSAVLTLSAKCRDHVKSSVRDREPDAQDDDDPLDVLLGQAKTVVEFLTTVDIGAPERWSTLRVGYLGGCSPCAGAASGAADPMIGLLRDAGFTVVPLAEAGVCCGGRGAFPYMQSRMAEELRGRKLRQLARTDIDVVAVDDVGCTTVLGGDQLLPAVHTVELLDWAYGGPVPSGLGRYRNFAVDVPVPEETPEAAVS
ncbi:MAG: heterodisulfide reductase-related iron-sulfur binding cluster [Pseudomonadota bacterium]